MVADAKSRMELNYGFASISAMAVGAENDGQTWMRVYAWMILAISGYGVRMLASVSPRTKCPDFDTN